MVVLNQTTLELVLYVGVQAEQGALLGPDLFQLFLYAVEQALQPCFPVLIYSVCHSRVDECLLLDGLYKISYRILSVTADLVELLDSTFLELIGCSLFTGEEYLAVLVVPDSVF